MSRKLRWGILGCANIAIHSVIPGLLRSETAEVTAIASRGIEKAEAAAKQFGIPRAYGDYESLLQDPDVEAVYIPLPNHLHREWTIKAAQAGKHVLCEKPIALTAQEAEEMAAACEEAGVLLAEAFMYRHHPRYDRLKDLLGENVIGEVRLMRSGFTFNNAKDLGNVRYVKEWGGGSLYDVGCYPLSVARMLMGQEPEAVTVHAMFSPEHGDVDMSAAGTAEFAGGLSLLFDCGMWAAFRNNLEIVGTEGTIELPNAFGIPGDRESEIIVNVQGETRVEKFPALNAYTLQADNFAYAVWGERPQRYPAADAVANMKLLDACLVSATERRRVSL